MKTVSVFEAKTHLSRLLQRVSAGEEIVISRRNRPIARLVPIVGRPVFTPGQFAGRIALSDDFDEPLPDDLLDAFEGRS
ncbi:MAG: type II toxin-antitoxin system Phd/YefM family antitoxin [Chloroflexi bacterium]|nr:type II toxin-antitoxin system Phd/YefM family antitoxin [Chloroflexota bacterium]HEV8054390.1 type II toxin-antitoxin system Phd/YefM family antitoxin [Candidatus Limnocylindrales bacterium]